MCTRCVECEETITNPICPRCLGTEVKVWLKENMPELISFIGAGPRYGTEKCILCGKHMAVCAYCFTKDIYLEIMKRRPNLGEEFISCFNFDLREEFE